MGLWAMRCVETYEYWNMGGCGYPWDKGIWESMEQGDVGGCGNPWGRRMWGSMGCREELWVTVFLPQRYRSVPVSCVRARD